jgi:membrane associated rhomboid family serine protease
MALTLIIIYIVTAFLGGGFIGLNLDWAYPLLQDNEAVWAGQWWLLITSMFLHADVLHIGGNVLFLLLFGTALEEQVPATKWLVTYFGSGLGGNLAFLLLGGDAVGLGASGAIWGLLGAAGGRRGVMGMVLYGGLNIFSGGGFLAHAGGLIVGLILRRWYLNL